MESPTSQQQSNLLDLGEARIQKLISQASSPNGYEREAAVTAIKRLNAPQLLPTLIRRANDWVSSVSMRATEALTCLLRTENQAFFIEVLPDIFHLAQCGRRDHSQLIAAVLEFLLGESQKHSLIGAISHPNPKISSIAFHLSTKHSLVSKKELLSLAIKSENIAVVRAAAQLINEVDDEGFLLLSQELIWHKCSAVSSRAIKRLNLLTPKEIEKLSADLIFNRSAEIRTIARSHLAQCGVDVLSLYRNELNYSAAPLYKRRVALIGICETASEKSLNDLTQASISPEPSLRSLAITRLVKLLGDKGRYIAIVGIFDESPKVARESAIAFIKQGLQCSVEELLQLTRLGKSPNRFDVAMFLAEKGNKWDHIIFLLELIQRQIGEDDLIRENYTRWHTNYNRRQTQPTKQQLVQLQDIQLKDETLTNELAQILKIF